MLRDVVDGSNESLYHPNEENYTHFPPRSPSERISELDGVNDHWTYNIKIIQKKIDFLIKSCNCTNYETNFFE